MRLKVDISQDKQRVLIVDKTSNEANHTQTQLVKALKKELIKYQLEVFLSPQLPQKIGFFDCVFFINDEHFIFKIKQYIHKKIIAVFIEKKKIGEQLAQIIKQANYPNIKIINISTDLKEEVIDKILWFSFLEGHEIFLNLSSLDIIKKNPKLHKTKFSFSFLSTIISHKKRLIFILILLLLSMQLIFIPNLVLSSYFFYKSSFDLRNNRLKEAKKDINVASVFLKFSKRFYHFSKPGFAFFSLNLFFDNIIDINDRSKTIASSAIEGYENSAQIVKLVLNKNKSSKSQELLKIRIKKLDSEVINIYNNVNALNQELPTNTSFLKQLKKDLSDLIEVLSKIRQITVHLDYLLASNTKRRYLLLFANNMELRPGGGFIGSFGTLTFNNYSLEDIQIYDVYDADGQLKEHVEPPLAIKVYLDQPHWFLRDSAFSPDFFENYFQAKQFLKKEMAMSDFSGGILLTTTTLKNFLKASGEVYLTDYKENINSDNFYLKSQLYAEKDFFPGSIQKKSFLGSLTKHILLNLEDISPTLFMASLKKSFDEKQAAVYFEDPKMQSVFDSLYWSGKMIKPQCLTPSNNCIINYIFPIEANLGVNKANFFINRYMRLKINIDSEGKINNYLSIRFINTSPNDYFPGGTYKNYFQLLLPKNTKIKKITKNDILTETYDEKDSEFKNVGLFLEIAPKKTLEIQIEYQLTDLFEQGKKDLQFIIQKQIGVPANDFIFELNLPSNMYLLNQNITSVVKKSQIVYNTNLSTDRIFILELLKD